MAGRLSEHDWENPYSGGLEDYISGGVQAAAPSILGGLSMGTGLGIAGAGLSAYGTYQQAKQAEKQYDLMLQAYQAEQQRQKREEERQRREAQERQTQQAFTNAIAGGQHAEKIKKDIQDTYGSYARTYGT